MGAGGRISDSACPLGSTEATAANKPTMAPIPRDATSNPRMVTARKKRNQARRRSIARCVEVYLLMVISFLAHPNLPARDTSTTRQKSRRLESRRGVILPDFHSFCTLRPSTPLQRRDMGRGRSGKWAVRSEKWAVGSSEWAVMSEGLTAHLPLTTHHSPLPTHHSSLTTHHSPLTTHHSPLTTHHSPLITHHSSLTTHHSPLTTHHSPLPTYHSPLTTAHSPLTTAHSPLTTAHSPLTTSHSPLLTPYSPHSPGDRRKRRGYSAPWFPGCALPLRGCRRRYAG